MLPNLGKDISYKFKKLNRIKTKKYMWHMVIKFLKTKDEKG